MRSVDAEVEQELGDGFRCHRGPSVGIAEDLYLSVTTVKTHISAIFTKLGASNRVDIARTIYEARLDPIARRSRRRSRCRVAV